MRKFKIALKPLPDVIFVEADDFNTEVATSEDKGVYFNFWVQPEEEDAVSVAAVPFENVLYIAVQPKP